MDLQERKDSTKRFIKELPIWDETNKLSIELNKFKHDLSSCLEDLNLGFKSVTRLEEISEQRITVNEHDKPVTSEPDIVDLDDSLELLRQNVKRGENVFAMLKPGKPWVKCSLIVARYHNRAKDKGEPYIMFKLRTPPGSKNSIITVDKYSVARIQRHHDKLKPSKRVIAGQDELNMLPGIVGNEPSELDNFRYLVHMDDGGAAYFKPDQVYPILWQSAFPWQDIRHLSRRENDNEGYIRHILGTYPRRHLMRISIGDKTHIDKDGVLLPVCIVDKDVDIAKVRYEDGSTETVYLGTRRFLKGLDVMHKQLRNVKDVDHFHSKVVYFMHEYHRAGQIALNEDLTRQVLNSTISTGHNTARKSTSRHRANPEKKVRVILGSKIKINNSRIEFCSNEDFDRSQHKCDPSCLISTSSNRTEIDTQDIIDGFRELSDLKVPMRLGWRRMLTDVEAKNGKSKKVILYKSPCGRLFRHPHMLKKYLTDVDSILDIDYFCFDREVELSEDTEEFNAVVFVPNLAKDNSGRPLENKFVSLLNQYDDESLPADFEYRSESFPHPMLAAKGFTFNHEFKSGCDCEHDCYSKASCACHRLNEEFYGSNAHLRGTFNPACQYKNKRLYNQVNTGIFECNSMCKCSSKCANRVVQNGIRFRLQVQKYDNGKGWGVVSLDEIPAGAFICTYAAELLDDADQYGDSDMYYADLDYISMNEQRKGTSSDDNSDEGLDLQCDDLKSKRKSPCSSNDDTGSEEPVNEEIYLPRTRVRRNPTRLRRRHDNFKKIHSILDSHDYTLDARMQGNLGRFFNHSCDPNCFAQNVFIETHDLRFPNVAFFAIRKIHALDEITWDYNYKMGCIEGRQIVCLCGKSNCRGRIL